MHRLSSTRHLGSVSRRVLSLLAGVVLFLVLLAALATWSIGRFAPRLLNASLESKAGAHLTVQTNQTNLFVGRVLFEDFLVTNPSRWTNPSFIKGKRLALDLDPASFVGSGRRLIHLVELDIDEVTLVGHEDYLKDNNAQDILRALRATDESAVATAMPIPAEPSAGFLIEKLRLRVGRVKIIAADGTPQRRVVVDRQFDLVFEAQNISDTNLAQTVTDPLGKQVITQNLAGAAGLLIDLTKEKVRQSITEKLLNEK